jgi:hypothetical protein
MQFREDVYGYVVWNGGGSSTWNNVDVFVTARGWTESCGGGPRGNHYWFGSRIVVDDAAQTAQGYVASCAESWFFGSEITVNIDCSNGATQGADALNVTGPGEVHLYGSVVRIVASCSTQAGYKLNAATAKNGGNIHIHGTGIDVLSDASNNIAALNAASDGSIHVNGSAYNLYTYAGTATRIVNNGGHVHAPYLWEHIPDSDDDPNTAANFASANGADMTTVTTGTLDSHPHMVVYSATCAAVSAATPWWDAVDRVCR